MARNFWPVNEAGGDGNRLTVDGQSVSLSAGIKGSLNIESGSMKFTQTGTNVLTASVTDGFFFLPSCFAANSEI